MCSMSAPRGIFLHGESHVAHHLQGTTDVLIKQHNFIVPAASRGLTECRDALLYN